MSEHPSFSPPAMAESSEASTRYIVTFREDSVTEGLALMKKEAAVGKLPNAADFAESAMDLEQMDNAGGAVFPALGMAVVTLELDALNSLMAVRGEDAVILDIEPERMFYALSEEGSLPLSYLRGYRDAVNHLFDVASAGAQAEGAEPTVTFLDDAVSTWGLKATSVMGSRFTGRGTKVAVLDTGMDLAHPDFRGRSITTKSFISGETVQDGNGHGTHCIGTSCGFKDVNGRRYGIAYEAAIFAGKVLSNSGSGATSGILAGMEWAIIHGCQVISMSLGNLVTTPSTAYEQMGKRALQRGSLIVAAAGNHGQNPSPGNSVGQPANSPSIMAVAAVNNQLQRAPFSAVSGAAQGANVDIAGPGVAVYSSVPMNRGRYATFNGTSMATPHVAGVAALYSQAFQARGAQLWQLLVSRARRLPLPGSQVGAGLVQAPV